MGEKSSIHVTQPNFPFCLKSRIAVHLNVSEVNTHPILTPTSRGPGLTEGSVQYNATFLQLKLFHWFSRVLNFKHAWMHVILIGYCIIT